ncbi:MAG: SUMF1/EgtB/PvdO family nonheme iron enzyme [Flavobacteriales bacterium]|nr:SUMF1/EgtB/PvdO family nonheme iron enzyme [Flavobacteriales bacterium]
MFRKLFLLFILAACTLTVQAKTSKMQLDSAKMVEKQRKKFIKQTDFVYIPKGSFRKGLPPTKGSTESREEVVSVDEFYMINREITNIDYLEFLYWLKTQKDERLANMLPDTMVWRSKLAYNEPYVEYYLRHPAYRNYPIVGVSYNQAIAFCDWLSDRYNERPDKIYNKVRFRLPTEKEWEYAARGGLELSLYPWGGPYVRNAKGDFLANCQYFGESGICRDTLYTKNEKGEFEPISIYRVSPSSYYMGVPGQLNDNGDVTAPAISYAPNAYGLYNMAGNVAEMVMEEGVSCGGSWMDPAYYMQNHVRQYYKGKNSSSSKRGFRIVMEVID